MRTAQLILVQKLVPAESQEHFSDLLMYSFIFAMLHGFMWMTSFSSSPNLQLISNLHLQSFFLRIIGAPLRLPHWMEWLVHPTSSYDSWTTSLQTSEDHLSHQRPLSNTMPKESWKNHWYCSLGHFLGTSYQIRFNNPLHRSLCDTCKKLQRTTNSMVRTS